MIKSYLLLLFFVLILIPFDRLNANAPFSFQVIVNQKNPVTSLDRSFVSDAFLKKVTRWPGDQIVLPVDLGPDSELRSRFTKELLKRLVGAIKTYWQQKIFSGLDVPPPELASEYEVIKFVAKHPGAIGYVSNNAILKGVHAVEVR